jgi:predicted nucleotidyltransferase
VTSRPVCIFFRFYLVFSEIISIFATSIALSKNMSDDKRSQIISLIRDTIRASEPTAQIILYGSRARGDAREDSDWDVLTIVDKPRLTLKDRNNIQFLVWDKGLELGQEINVFPYTRRQWEQAPPSLFKYNVLNEGIAL